MMGGGRASLHLFPAPLPTATSHTQQLGGFLGTWGRVGDSHPLRGNLSQSLHESVPQPRVSSFRLLLPLRLTHSHPPSSPKGAGQGFSRPGCGQRSIPQSSLCPRQGHPGRWSSSPCSLGATCQAWCSDRMRLSVVGTSFVPGVEKGRGPRGSHRGCQGCSPLNRGQIFQTLMLPAFMNWPREISKKKIGIPPIRAIRT